MSALRDYIEEFVTTLVEESEWSRDDVADALRDAVDAHFTAGDEETPQAAPEESPGTGLYRDVITIEVLSDTRDRAEWPVALLAPYCQGSWDSVVMQVIAETGEEVTRARMAELLVEAGSDADYFGGTCRFPGCEHDPDDGEGWDGWCGHHADVIEGHVADDPDDRHAPGSRADDCAVCAGHLSERDARSA